MMQRMPWKRLIAAGALLVAAGAFVAFPACIVAVDQENGGTCIKDFDCDSRHCVAGKCVSPNGDACQTDQGCASGKCTNGHCQPIPYDATPPEDTAVSDAPTDSPAESAADAPTETPADSGTGTDTATPPDTTPDDTGLLDLGVDVPAE
jgi:hypothetical protein